MKHDDYKRTVIIEDSSEAETILNFNIDSSMNRLLIFSKFITNSKRELYQARLFDLYEMKTITEIVIKDKEHIGRFESGLYTFVDGHIYFGNNCFKMRYDLLKDIESKEDKKMPERIMFDHY